MKREKDVQFEKKIQVDIKVRGQQNPLLQRERNTLSSSQLFFILLEYQICLAMQVESKVISSVQLLTSWRPLKDHQVTRGRKRAGLLAEEASSLNLLS